MRALVAIEMHDVAPATWPECEALLDALAPIGAKRVTLLVVPHYHRGVPIDDAPAFVEAIARRTARGDEVALHGLVHLDEAPAPRTLRGAVERRLLTRREGEFAAIGETEARNRIEHAIAMLRATGLPFEGFVPPAWLLSPQARAAIDAGMPFRYVALRGGLFRLPEWRWLPSDTMWYSPTSAARRWMSRAAIALAAARASPARLLRIALHPQDARQPDVVAHWQRVIARALAERSPVTLGGALTRLAPAAASFSATPRPIRRASARARSSHRSAGS